jgi:hypothetical protein
MGGDTSMCTSCASTVVSSDCCGCRPSQQSDLLVIWGRRRKKRVAKKSGGEDRTSNGVVGPMDMCCTHKEEGVISFRPPNIEVDFSLSYVTE